MCGRDGTKLTPKLDFPGKLCLAPFAILAMFDFLPHKQQGQHLHERLSDNWTIITRPGHIGQVSQTPVTYTKGRE